MTIKKEHKSLVLMCTWVLFIIYMIALVYFLFFSEQMGRKTSDVYKYSLVPFKEIKRYLQYKDQLGMGSVILNIVGNVVAFAPFGFVLPIITKYRKCYKVLLLSLEFSLVVEIIQLVSKVGSFDVDDLILNTIGGVIGYVSYKILYRLIVWEEPNGEKA